MKDQDAIFFKNFSLLLGFLVILTFVLAFAGYAMHESYLGTDEMAKDRSDIANSIAPVAKVNTGGVMVAKVVDTNTSAVAFDGSTDGQMLYTNVCSACHSTGAGGAPKLEAAAWTDRLAKGNDELIKNAIEGFQGSLGLMPAKGGRADLSDEQVIAIVEYMTNSLN